MVVAYVFSVVFITSVRKHTTSYYLSMFAFRGGGAPPAAAPVAAPDAYTSSYGSYSSPAAAPPAAQPYSSVSSRL